MSRLAILSLKNRALIALITIVAAVFGGLALVSLKQELIPSVEFPRLSIVTSYPGASPEVVANDVSTPIERAIQGVDGLDATVATSTAGASVVQATFTYGTDLTTAEQKISQAIGRIDAQLPAAVEPDVVAASTDDYPVLQLAVTGFTDEQAVKSLLESEAAPRIEDIEGVNAAQVLGGVGERITITPDSARLAQRGFSPQSIADALQTSGSLFAGGAITRDDESLTVQTGSRITSVEQLRELPLVPADEAQAGAGVTRISDVASVEITHDPVTSISRVDGEPALSVSVTKTAAANTVEVSQAVRALLPDLEQKLGGATFTIVFDQAPYIERSIEALAQEGLLGLVFAVLVILVFLLSVRSTIVTAISIPTSVLVTFLGLQWFGYSLNMLTLGALTIAIGRVVDDSIVVIENIKRHYVGDAEKLPSITRAVREVAAAITASTLTTVAVFLPIAFVGGITGELFRPFSVTVTLAMAASLLVSLTIVPALAYWFLRPGKPLRDARGNPIDPEAPEAPADRLQKAYLPVLKWTLRHSWVTLGAAFLVLVGTVALATSPLLKINFLGDSGENTFTMTQKVGDAPSLEAEDAAAAKVEEAVLAVEGVETVELTIGSSGSALLDSLSGAGSGITYAITTDPDADQMEVRERVREAVAELDAGEVTIAENAAGGSSDVQVTVSAPDAATLQEATDALTDAFEGREGVGQVSTNLAASLPYIAVEVKRDAAAQRGLSEAAVGGIVAGVMQPREVGSAEIDGEARTVYMAASHQTKSVEELRRVEIPSAAGPVRLEEIATIEERQSATSITTERGDRTATITVAPDADNLAVTGASVSEALAETTLPAAADAAVGGVLSEQNEGFAQLFLAMLAAILIVYVIMVATFKSLLQPLLLLVSVPFAATGAIAMLVVTDVPLGVAGLIGGVMLVGIVVTNAIVLIDLVNQYRERGLSAREATLAGGSRRLRPILMTALATIFALTPMALGITGHGGFISKPLAVVVIGGLVSSTVLTLLVLPTLYDLVVGARERRAIRRRTRSAARADAVLPAVAATAAAPEHDAARGDAPVQDVDLPEPTTVRG